VLLVLAFNTVSSREAVGVSVELAAKVHGVEPAQIAKTICLRVGDKTLLIVASGIARLDNRKVKDVPGGKGRMLDPEQVLAVTRHSVGGVCPFGLLSPLPVYCDIYAAALQRGCARGRFGAMQRLKSPRKGSPS
jgi:prolyl-tRNA editing enzyme YbaK/EbsC (Cys-tRNA(Pro) deacylase)